MLFEADGELWAILHHTLDRAAHYAPRDGISGGPRGTVSQRPCGVMPAWPFVFLLSDRTDKDWVNGRFWRKADVGARSLVTKRSYFPIELNIAEIVGM